MTKPLPIEHLHHVSRVTTQLEKAVEFYRDVLGFAEIPRPAFDFRGADWLQSGEEVENPYFGSTMFRCGTLDESFGPASEGE